MSADESERELTPPSCFVIGPIGEREAEVGTDTRKIYEETVEVWEQVILPACSGFGIEPVRADHITRTGDITDQVCRRLRDDKIVIADLTGANPNVMYELGLRHTTGRLTIQIGEKDRLPFDVSTIRTILFRRSEGGLIDARRRLTEAIATGLKSGGDPVSATRIWFEPPALPVEVKEVGPQDSPHDDQPGFLELQAEMIEGLLGSTATLQTITNVYQEITALTTEATGRIDRHNKTTGAAPRAKVELTNRFADQLEEPAGRLEVLAGEYKNLLDRMRPGMAYTLGVYREKPSVLGNDTSFPAMVKTLANSARTALETTVRFRQSVLETGEATRSLRKVSARIAASLQILVDSLKNFEEWERLLP
jgi:hypothetical protein